MLQDSFKAYVFPSEASVIEGCLADSITCDNDEMLDFLLAFDCKRKVTQQFSRSHKTNCLQRDRIKNPNIRVTAGSQFLLTLRFLSQM